MRSISAFHTLPRGRVPKAGEGIINVIDAKTLYVSFVRQCLTYVSIPIERKIKTKIFNTNLFTYSLIQAFPPL